MTRYFFNCAGAQAFEDQDGTELADDHCAMMQAILTAAEVMTDHAAAFSETPVWRMTVSDDAGRVVFRLNFTIDR